MLLEEVDAFMNLLRNRRNSPQPSTGFSCRRNSRKIQGLNFALIVFASLLGYTSCTSSFRDSSGLTKVDDSTSKFSAGEEEVPPSSQANYYFIRGELALSDHDFDTALNYFERAGAVETKPAPLLRKRLAQMYVRSGKLQEALAELDKIGEEGSRDSDILELRAGILATLKDIPRAIATYRQLIDLTPEKPNEEAYALLASLYAENGDLPSAKKVLRELIDRSPKSVFGYYYLARATEASGSFKEAEILYKKAIALSPASEAIRLDLARSYGAQKRYHEGVGICEDLIKKNPQNIAARQLLGQLLLGDNRVDEALKQYESLGSLETDPTSTRFKIAMIKLERRDLGGAEVELNLILAKDPNNSQARYYLGLTYAGMQKVKEALTELDRIPASDKFYGEAKLLSAYLARQDKQSDRALHELEEAIKVKGDDIRLLSFYVSLSREAGKIDNAIAAQQKLIGLEPNNDSHYFMLGVLQDEAGKIEDAEGSMRKAIALNDKNSDALNYLGYTFAERGLKLDEAEKLVRQAIGIDPKNGYYVDSLGWVFYKMGKLPEAQRELERATELTPNDAVIMEHLAIILLARGDKLHAAEIAARALQFAPNSDDKEVGGRLKSLLSRIEDLKHGDPASQ